MTCPSPPADSSSPYKNASSSSDSMIESSCFTASTLGVGNTSGPALQLIHVRRLFTLPFQLATCLPTCLNFGSRALQTRAFTGKYRGESDIKQLGDMFNPRCDADMTCRGYRIHLFVKKFDLHALVVYEIHARSNGCYQTRPFEVDATTARVKSSRRAIRSAKGPP